MHRKPQQSSEGFGRVSSMHKATPAIDSEFYTSRALELSGRCRVANANIVSETLAAYRNIDRYIIRVHRKCFTLDDKETV